VVAAILFAFLLNWRTTAISLTAIPVSILTTAIIFYFAGLSINTMTLGGLAIAIGELVDDAVVDVENIFRRLRENRAQGSPRSVFDVVVSASQEVRSGIVYATMIIVLVFVPLFALSGIEGRLFAPLGHAYIISILASLLVSITLTPVMAYYLLPGLKRLEAPDGAAGARAQARNAALLDARFPRNGASCRRRRPLRGVVAARASFCRARSCRLQRRHLHHQPPVQPGISLAESNRVGLIAERLMLEVSESRSVGRRTGRAELDEHAEGCILGDRGELKPSSRAKPEIVADFARGCRCCRRDQYRPADLAPPRPPALGRARRDRASSFRRRPRCHRSARTICAAASPRSPASPTCRSRSRCAFPSSRSGSTTAARRSTACSRRPSIDQFSRLSNGRVISRVVDGYRRFDVTMRLSDRLRTTQRLGDLLIETPSGWVPARQIAEIKETDGPNQILRENGRRRIVVLANTDGTRRHARIVRHPPRDRAHPAARGLLHRPRRHLPGAGGREPHHRHAVAAVARVIFAILYSRYRSAVLA
jgi:HME family heavy-metal exporter